MRDFPNDVLSKNLLALSGFNLNLATAIGEAHPDERVSSLPSKSGEIVPCIQFNQRPRPLHSQFNPVREAQRLCSQHAPDGFIIVLGLGGGFHIRELLNNPRIESILIIDFEISLLRSLLSLLDMSDIFIDPRVRIFIDPSPTELHDYLLERYIPSVMGNIRSLPLRSRTNLSEAQFAAVMQTIRRTIESVSEDYAVQARFGRRWMSNTMANLAIAGRVRTQLLPQRRTMIIAAGPSLDESIDEIHRLRPQRYCIATDTAVPWLLQHKMYPDIILSIDCQLVTYHHFMAGIPEDIPILFDLASPPTLTRKTANPLFFSSGHPFSQYVRNHLEAFPSIDTSGGNVTHAAVSLANTLGAEVIDIFGADYCYPNGKTYAKDTYLFRHFRASEHRLQSAESAFADFVFDSHKVEAVANQFALCYSSPNLRSYQQRLKRFVKQLSGRIVNHSPYGPELESPQPDSQEIPLLAWKPGTEHWRVFLEGYAAKLRQLPVPDADLTRFFTDQDLSSLELWLTVFPAASYFRHTSGSVHSGGELLKRTIGWIIAEVEKTLESHH